jgi:ABC-type transport system involved in multi-copper enzyme maturation permease subunit
MLLTLIRKEMLSQIMNIRFYVSFALALLLLVPSTYILATDYGLMQKEYGPLIGKGFYTPGGWDRFWVCREIPRLRVLASGLDENLSLRSHNTVYEGAYFGESQFVHNFLSDVLSHLDFVFFINIVGSLLAFTFTYDAISGERQRGTLRLVMANPVRRALLLLSKFLGSYFSFVISVLPALGAVVLVLYLHPDVGFGSSDWEASFWLLVLAMLNVGVYFMLGVFVSCITREPRTTLTALIMIWVFLVLVVPNFSPFIAAKLHPIPAFHQVQRQADTLTQESAQPVRRQQHEFLDAHGGKYEAMSEENKMEYQAIWADHCRTFYARELTKVWEAFFNQMDAQAKLAQCFSLVSPSATFTYLASDLAHTGIESEHAFRFATIGFRRQYAANLGEYIQRTGDKTKLWTLNDKLIPPFEMPKPTISTVISSHLLQFMSIILYGFLCFCGAYVVFVGSLI